MPGVSTNECPVSLIPAFAIIANEMCNRGRILKEVIDIFAGADTPARLVDALEVVEVERLRTNNLMQEYKAMEMRENGKDIEIIDG